MATTIKCYIATFLISLLILLSICLVSLANNLDYRQPTIRYDNKVLQNTVVTPLVEIALPSGDMSGGQIFYTVVSTNGIDYQVHTGSAYYAAVNKGGVYTTQIMDEAVTADANARSAGTLAEAWTIATGVNSFTINVQFSSNLAGGITMSINYSLLNSSRSIVTLQ